METIQVWFVDLIIAIKNFFLSVWNAYLGLWTWMGFPDFVAGMIGIASLVFLFFIIFRSILMRR